MLEKDKLEAIINKQCKECEIVNNFHFNGERSEGLSFLVTGQVDSWFIDRIAKAINEAYPEMKPLTGYRIQIGRKQTPCKGVAEDLETSCLEIRLMTAEYGSKY